MIGAEGPFGSKDWAQKPDGRIPQWLDWANQEGITTLFPHAYCYGRDYVNLWQPDQRFYSASNPVKLSYFDKLAIPNFLLSLCEQAEKKNIRIGATIFPCKGITRPASIPGIEKVMQIDINGAPTKSVCFNHPQYIDHYESMLKDLFTNHPLAGMHFGSENGGPLFMFLLYGRGRPPACFCEHCVKLAQAQGTDAARAKAGFRELIQLFGDTPRGGPWKAVHPEEVPAPAKRPDGFFVNFLRILFQYPEVLMWDRLWFQGQEHLQILGYKTIKKIRPAALVGNHLWHRGLFSPFMRAQEDCGKLARYSDFLRPAVFSNGSGSRFLEGVVHLQKTIFADFKTDEVVSMLYKILGIPNQGPFPEIAKNRFGPSYVEAEIIRVKNLVNAAVAAQAGAGPLPETGLPMPRTQVYAGVAVSEYSQADPEDDWSDAQVTDASAAADIQAAKKAGADGIIFASPHARWPLAIRKGLKSVGWAS